MNQNKIGNNNNDYDNNETIIIIITPDFRAWRFCFSNDGLKLQQQR